MRGGGGANCLFNSIQRMFKPFARTFSFNLILLKFSNQPTSTLSHFKAKRTYKYKHRLLHFLVYFKLVSSNSLSSFLLFFNDHPTPDSDVTFSLNSTQFVSITSCFHELLLLICTIWRISIHCQETTTKSEQQPYIPVTAFSQTDLFLN